MAGRDAILRAFDPRASLRGIFVRDASPHHLAALDGIRALAILWVVAFHAGWYAWFTLPRGAYAALLRMPGSLAFWRGDFGVDVFFVLSGFLIGGMLLDERARSGRVRVLAFYARRLLRLWPALVVAALAELAWGPALGRDVHLLWPNLLYVNNLLPVRHVRMGWTWSLAIEEQFYLSVPWVLGGLARLRARAPRVDPVLAGLAVLLAAQIAVSIGVAWAFDLHARDSEIVVNRPLAAWYPGYDLLYAKPWMRAGPLLVGIGAARVWRTPSAMERLGRSGWAGTTAIGVAIALAGVSTHWPWAASLLRPLELLYLGSFRAVFGLAAGFSMLFVLSSHALGARLGRLLALPAFYPIAQLAYCGYLVNPIIAAHTHRFLGVAVALDTPALAYATLLAADLLGTFAAAIVLAVLVERPFMALRKTLVP